MAISSIILGAVLLMSSPSRQSSVQLSDKRADIPRQEPPPLTFKDDGKFQISIFEDLHFGEAPSTLWGPRQDINTTSVINKILDSEPAIDLVVLNGDLITGENAWANNSTDVVDQIVRPFVERNMTWASTYGNHDSSFNLSRNDIFAREISKWPWLTQTKSMVGPGVTNYYLPVYPRPECASNVTACVPALILWFFDSRGGHLFNQTLTRPDPEGSKEWVGQPNWVGEEVVAWFNETNAALQSQFTTPEQKIIPSLAFVHIPTNASLTLQKRGIDPQKEPGINEDEPVSPQAQGWCPDSITNNDTCAYGGQDVPFMKALVATHGLMALFSGHDHGDTWCARWDGTIPGEMEDVNGTRSMNLCFGQHTGYGGYGSWIRGGRQVVVELEKLARDENDMELETYIRLESGDVVGAVTLNSTYGQDVYPVTPDQTTWS